MRKITGALFVSLDGVMQSPGRSDEDVSGGFAQGGWISAYTDEITSTAVRGYLLGEPYDLLLGHATYDIFAPYWPNVPAGNPIGDRFNAAAKHVLTRSASPLSWHNSHRLANLDAVRALKASPGPDLLIQGSTTLYPQLLAAGLIDTLIIQTFPLLLGPGKRLFGPGTPPLRMALERVLISSTGVTIATYVLGDGRQAG
jgi:dihydrofolate reductase